MTETRPPIAELLEGIFPEAGPAGAAGPFRLRRSADWLVGLATFPAGPDLEASVRDAYRRLLDAAKGGNLCRIWNFVPDINGAGSRGLERYRAFCLARSGEFEREYGPEFRRRLPASSAVGCDSAELTVAFAASPAPLLHRENPRQVPAYDYPPAYGPRPPSFSRATVVPFGGESDVFVSGTSAVVGHASVAPGDTLAQLECTLENLRAISRECGLGPDLGREAARSRHFSVYLRLPSDRPAVAGRLESRLFGPADSVAYLKADICRSELNVEIEATIRGAPAGR